MSLRLATLAYLYLPLAIFLVGWLRPIFAVPLLVAMGAAARRFRPLLADEPPPRRTLAVAALVALAWTALSGAGGAGPQRPDWRKHNAVLKDLIEKTWPPVYLVDADALAGQPPERVVRPLVFYLAYYLPSAVVGKVAGWTAANLALFAWTWCGVTLALLWAARLGGPRAGMWVLVLAGGLDLLGYVAGKRQLPPANMVLDFWMGPWRYQASSGLLFWVPHQALGAWLGTALVLDASRRGVSTALASLEAFAVCFWSPFAALGLLPFWALRVARRPLEWLRAWPNWTVFPSLALLLAAFYAALYDPLPRQYMGAEILGPLWRRYLLHSAIEWGLLFVLCRPFALPGWRVRAALVAAVLAAVPFVSMGLYNDFSMRAPMPALFVLWMLVAQRLEGGATDPGWTRWRARVLVAACVVAALTGTTEIARSLRHYRIAVPSPEAVAELPASFERRALARQYLGDPEALFFRLLARRGPP